MTGARKRTYTVLDTSIRMHKAVKNAGANPELMQRNSLLAAAAARESGFGAIGSTFFCIPSHILVVGCGLVAISLFVDRPVAFSRERPLDLYYLGTYSSWTLQHSKIQTRVEHTENSAFFGVFDGYLTGTSSSRYCNQVYDNLAELSNERGNMMSPNIIQEAYARTENGLNMGSSLLFALIWDRTLYIGSLGDSIGVMAYVDTRLNEIKPVRLNEGNTLDRFRANPKPNGFLDYSYTTPSTGEYFIKGVRNNEEDSGDIVCVRLSRCHRFLILATHGFWEFLSDIEAVEMVKNSPNEGVASRLVDAALRSGASRNEISVFVIFFDMDRGEGNPGLLGF